MKNTINLIKINVSSMFKMMFKSKNKSGVAKNIAIPIFLLGIIFVGMLFNYMGVLENLKEMNMPELIFFQAGLFTFTFVVLMTSSATSGYIYNCKDYEMLSVLPLKTSQIVISKLVSVFIFGYIFAFAFFVPAIIVYFIAVPFNLVILLTSIIGYIFVPIVPTIVGILVGYIISLISSHTKFKNIVTILLAFVFMGLYFAFCFSSNSIILYLAQNSSLTLKYLFFSIIMYITGFIQLNILDIFCYLIFSLLLLLLTIVLVSLSYNKVNLSFIYGKSKTKRKKGELTYFSHSINKALLKKELKTYFSIPIWVVNTLMVYIMAVIFPVLLRVIGGNLLFGLNSSIATIVLSAVISAMLISGNMSAASVSVEGKNFYITKSLPIGHKTFFASKILACLFVTLPFSLLSSIVSIILFFDVLGIWGSVFVLIIPMTAVISCSIFGLLINLLHPNLEWQNVSEVIKSGLPIFIVAFGGMALNGIACAVLVSVKLGQVLASLIYLAIYIVLGVVSYILLNKKGEELYNNL